MKPLVATLARGVLLGSGLLLIMAWGHLATFYSWEQWQKLAVYVGANVTLACMLYFERQFGNKQE